MGDINPSYRDRIKYTLYHSSIQPFVINDGDVVGWEDDDKELGQHEKWDGIYPQFSNSLKFYNDAREVINTIKSIHGINATIRITKDVTDDRDVFIRSYTGYLNLLTWEEEDYGVSVKMDSGGLEKLRKSNEKEKVELERVTSLLGNSIPELDIVQLSLPGRRIYLETKFNTNTTNNSASTQVASNAGNTRSNTCGLPLNMFSQSHEFANNVLPESHGDENNGITGMMFYANNDRNRLLNIDLSASFNAYFQQYERIQWCFYQLCLTVYKDGISYNLKNRIVLHALDSGLPTGHPDKLPGPDFGGVHPPFTKSMNGLFNGQIQLLEGESIALEVLLKADMYSNNNAGVRVFPQDINLELTITEDSYYQPTITKGIMVYEYLERLVEIATGDRKNFKSKYFGRTDIIRDHVTYTEDGPGSLQMISHGHWIRQFESGDELYKPITSCLKDALESLEVTDCISLGIEKIGFREVFVVEDKRDFYNQNVTIRLGEMVNGTFTYSPVEKLKKSVDEKFYFTGIEIGSEKGGDYEEIMGLYETNTSANFSTCIVIENPNVYVMKSKHRFDPYGVEIPRRRNKNTHPTTDFTYDTDLYQFDVKRGPDGVYDLKTWEDVLEEVPVGMFSPETSFNFLYSPVQLLLKHGWYLNGCLQEYPQDYIRFGSSIGKSTVTMKRIGFPAYAENGDILNGNLERPRFTPLTYEFTHTVSDDLYRTIEGSSTILGKTIRNYYGLTEFMDSEGIVRKGKVKTLKPNKEGKWNLINSYR